MIKSEVSGNLNVTVHLKAIATYLKLRKCHVHLMDACQLPLHFSCKTCDPSLFFCYEHIVLNHVYMIPHEICKTNEEGYLTQGKVLFNI